MLELLPAVHVHLPTSIEDPVVYYILAVLRPVLVCMYIFVVMIIGERAKRARHYQGCTNLSWCGICVYTCMEVRVP